MERQSTETTEEVRGETETAEEVRGETGTEKPGKKRLTIFGTEFVYLCFLAICMGFFGWFAENVVRLISVGVIDSRFHLLPCIGEYGLIVFAFHIVLGSPDDLAFFGKKIFKKKSKRSTIASNILAYVIFCAAVFLSELALGNLWDKVFGLKLWDYSKLPLCVTNYAGLIPTLGYGTAAYLVFKFAYTPMLNLVRRGGDVGFRVFKIIDCTLGVLILIDFIVMIVFFMAFRQAPMWWSIHIWKGAAI